MSENTIRYVELHCKSNFSFLEGASHAHELIASAKQFGYGGVAITDRDTLAGIVRAHTAAKDQEFLFTSVARSIRSMDHPWCYGPRTAAAMLTCASS